MERELECFVQCFSMWARLKALLMITIDYPLSLLGSLRGIWMSPAIVGWWPVMVLLGFRSDKIILHKEWPSGPVAFLIVSFRGWVQMEEESSFLKRRANPLRTQNLALYLQLLHVRWSAVVNCELFDARFPSTWTGLISFKMPMNPINVWLHCTDCRTRRAFWQGCARQNGWLQPSLAWF